MDGTIPLAVVDFGRRYRRGYPWALRHVSLTIPAGSIAALVGPNGAGKSTLIRACIGFERGDEGRVEVWGRDPRRDRSAVVASIGYVPQTAALYRSLTVADHMDLASASRPLFGRTVAEERLAALGIEGDRKVGTLSGGQQAQVALAIALGTRAPLLLLDEPMASLDPLARRDFLTSLVGDVRERGATAILSSHIVTDVEQACDYVVVLSSGTLALSMSIADACDAFAVVPAAQAPATAIVGHFASSTGEAVALVRREGQARASLEDVVLGHLASGRVLPGARAA